MARHSQRRLWFSEALVIVAVVLLPLLFWWRLWAPDPADRAIIPEGDFTSQYYPLRLFAARELAAGRLPTWNPYINAGQPGLADIQTGFYYPPNLVVNLGLAVLGQPFTIGILSAQVVLHFSLASLFTYLLARQLARRAGAQLAAARFSGAAAALAFTYGGYLTSFPVQQPTILETAVWLPLVLLFVDRGFHRHRPLSQVVLAGLSLACALLAGHPQTAMYVVYAVAAYSLFLTWSTHKPGTRVLQLAKRLAYLVLLPLAIGVVVAALQLVPTLDFISRSTRAGLDYDAVSWGFPLIEITHLLYPGYFGGSPQYLGILTPILVVAALFVKRARREVVFWLILGALAFILAFGGHTFLYSVLYQLAPGFGAVRNQERVIYLFGFAASVLVGYGALTLVQPLPAQLRRGYRRFVLSLVWLFAFFVALTALWYFGYLQGQQQGIEINLFAGVLRHHTLLLVILAGAVLLFSLRLSGRAGRGWLVALALGLMTLNLFTVNWRFNAAEPVAGGVYPETGLVQFLQAQPGSQRIASAGLLPSGSSAAIVYELEDTTGNTPLRLEAFQQFEDQIGSWRQWQLLNVGTVLDRRDLDGPGLERVYEEGDIKAYRMGDPLPRAWVVHAATVADDPLALTLLNAEDFDPRAMTVLAPEAMSLDLPGSHAQGEEARVVESAPGRLVLEATTTADGLLVISQPFYPGWQARIDDQPVPIARVDYLLQGVPLPAGTHRIEVRYRPSAVPTIISLIGLGGCIAALFVARVQAEAKVQVYQSKSS
ncbi:MAG: YfhO family protein [Anaerolineae bacterium]